MSRVVEVTQYGTAATGGRRLKVEVGRSGPQGPPGTGGGGGSGDVVGPASSVDGDVALFDGTTGNLLKAASGIDASKITSGTVSIDRLADSGVPDEATYLNGLSDLLRPTAVWDRVTFSNADYTVTSAYSILVAQTGTLTATRTVTLPALGDFTFSHPGTTFTQQVLIWTGAGVSAANKLVIAAASGQTINGASTFEITEANRLVVVMSNRLTSPTSTNPSWVVQTPDLNASNITTGTVATARLGSGTPSASNFLRGDGTWATPSGTGDVVGPASSVDNRVALFDGTTGKLLKQSSAALATVATSGSASDLSAGTLPFARLSLPVRRLAGTGISYTSPTELFGTPPTDIQGNVTTTALDAGRMRMTPCDIAGGPTLSTISFEVSASALSAGQSVTIGCYARASNGLPTGNPLWSHSVTVGTTTGTYNVSTTDTLPEGGCWLAFLNPSGNAGTVTIYVYQPVGSYLLALRSLTNRPALASTTGISALPDVSSYTVSNAASASVWGVAQQGVLLMLR